MIIQLLDYKGRKFPVEVPDNTQELHIKILSGDMVLLEPIYFDTGKGSRTYDFNDGEYFIKKRTLIK
jgi:translation initiation factor IF-1